MKARQNELHKAKSEQNDEFYTCLEDIDEEMQYYEKFFKNKVVYCNCDDPEESNFFQHFKLKFEYYGLKRLITTCYKSKDSTLFTDNSSNRSVGIDYYGNNLSLSLFLRMEIFVVTNALSI